nr:hypothetical protein [Tanacetum cinerariifolium]
LNESAYSVFINKEVARRQGQIFFGRFDCLPDFLNVVGSLVMFYGFPSDSSSLVSLSVPSIKDNSLVPSSDSVSASSLGLVMAGFE